MWVRFSLTSSSLIAFELLSPVSVTVNTHRDPIALVLFQLTPHWSFENEYIKTHKSGQKREKYRELCLANSIILKERSSQLGHQPKRFTNLVCSVWLICVQYVWFAQWNWMSAMHLSVLFEEWKKKTKQTCHIRNFKPSRNTAAFLSKHSATLVQYIGYP